MTRKLVAGAAGIALAIGMHPVSAGRAPSRDFDPITFASYADLRFSSAVPPAVIRRVLAGQGFSQRNLDLIGAASVPARSAAKAPKPRSRYGQQISQDRLPCPKTDLTECERDTEAEPHIAVNPDDPNNLVAVFQQGRYPDGGAVNNGSAASFDRGRTWPYKGSAPGLTVAVAPTGEGPGAPFERASDPVVAFDRKHRVVLFQSVAVSGKGCAIYCDSAMVVNISRNGGKTFGRPVLIREDVSDADGTSFVFNDKNWIAVDNNPTSRFYGRAYVAWDQVRCPDPQCALAVQVVVLSVSDDGGRTWSKLIEATHEIPGGQVHLAVGVQPIILPNGHVVIVYSNVNVGVYTYYGTVAAIHTTNGGKTWSVPIDIDRQNPFAEEAFGLRAPNVVSAAVDDNATIYLAYHDQRFGLGRNDIVLMSSADEGKTWSPPVNATPGEVDLDHFTPAIAAAGRTVHLTYRTRAPAHVSMDPLVNTVYRAIRNGKTVGGSLLLGPPTDVNASGFTTVGGRVPLKFLGDYAGMAASARSAHPIWCRAGKFPDEKPNPTNTHQRSYSAQIA